MRSSASWSSSAARIRRPSAGVLTSPIISCCTHGPNPAVRLQLRAPAPGAVPRLITPCSTTPPAPARNASSSPALPRARGPVLREALVERYLPLARQLARRYQRPEEPLDDLMQVASLGLVKAVDRFDASREVAFSSYAVPTILGEIKRHFRDRTWSVRVPRDLQEMALKVERAVGELTRDAAPPAVGPRAGRAPRHHRGAGARGARGRRRLPRDVARHAARHRRRAGRHAGRHDRRRRRRLRARRGARDDRPADAHDHAARARGAAPALRART